MDPMTATPAQLFTPQTIGGAENTLASKLKNARTDEELTEAAEEFEAVFIAQMLAPMFSGLETDGPFGGGHGEEVTRSMLYEEYAKEVVKSGGIGIADNLKAELLRAQEAAQAPISKE